MLREIIVPLDNTYLLKLPDNYVGKPLEVIAFSLDEKDQNEYLKASKSLAEIKTFFSRFTFNMKGFRFNRDEANNYE